MLTTPQIFANRIKRNRDNIITYFDAAGKKSQKSFAELYNDILIASDALRQRDMLGQHKKVVICGKMGYEWLTTALACILENTTFIALPETLQEEEIKASLAGIEFSGVVVDKMFQKTSSFSESPCILLNDILKNEDVLQANQLREIPSLSTDKIASEIIAFTSGSTASKRLKAFAVSLESSLQFTERYIRLFNIDSNDNWLICHTFSHIVHFEYALGGLFWGYNITLCGVLNLLMQGAELAPSVVVTVPSVYEKIATQIEKKFALNTNENALSQIQHTSVIDSNNDVIRRPLTKQAKAVIGDKIKMMLIGASPSPTSLQIFLLQNGLPLYEGYGMSETNMISCNTPGNTRISTTGKAWPGIEIRLGAEQCICVRTSPERSLRYINVDDHENRATFMDNGWVNTGDIGEIDEQGYIRIIGRNKDIIVNSGGKNINPSAIETQLCAIPGVSHAVIYGDRKPYLIALLAPAENHILPERQVLEKHIEELNASLPQHEKVLAFISLEESLSEAAGTLTRSGKARRNNVIDLNTQPIQALYG